MKRWIAHLFLTLRIRISISLLSHKRGHLFATAAKGQNITKKHNNSQNFRKVFAYLSKKKHVDVSDFWPFISKLQPFIITLLSTFICENQQFYISLAEHIDVSTTVQRVKRHWSESDFSREICHLLNVNNRRSSPVGPEEETTWVSTWWVIAAECDDEIMFTTELKSWETSLYMSVLKHMCRIRASAVIKHGRTTVSLSCQRLSGSLRVNRHQTLRCWRWHRYLRLWDGIWCLA